MDYNHSIRQEVAMDNITRRENEMAYIADESCIAQMKANAEKVYEFNSTKPWETEKLSAILRTIFGKTGENAYAMQPLRCDYGFNIEVGDNFFANYNFVVLDVAKVKIGNNVFIAPNVSIYTAGHPVHPEARNSMYEYGIPVTIGDDCWIGGNAVICPGVKIGNGVVIGAGSVVTKDVPDNVIACGNPCRVVRGITDEDRQFYYKKRKFDDEAMRYIDYGKNGKA